MEQAIQIGMTTKLQHVRSSSAATTRAGESAAPGAQRDANALMMAGMTIFLGWLVGGRASAILQLSAVLLQEHTNTSCSNRPYTAAHSCASRSPPAAGLAMTRVRQGGGLTRQRAAESGPDARRASRSDRSIAGGYVRI